MTYVVQDGCLGSVTMCVGVCLFKFVCSNPTCAEWWKPWKPKNAKEDPASNAMKVFTDKMYKHCKTLSASNVQNKFFTSHAQWKKTNHKLFQHKLFGPHPKPPMLDPQKKVYVPHFLGRTQKRHINMGDLGGPQRGPQRAILGHTLTIFRLFLSCFPGGGPRKAKPYIFPIFFPISGRRPETYSVGGQKST